MASVMAPQPPRLFWSPSPLAPCLSTRGHRATEPHENCPFGRRLSRGVKGPSRLLLRKSGSAAGSGVATLRSPVTAKMSRSCGVCEKRAELVCGLSSVSDSGGLAGRPIPEWIRCPTLAWVRQRGSVDGAPKEGLGEG